MPTQKCHAECSRTNPDFIVYHPESLDGSTKDTGNEHFLVFDGADGSLMALWCQSSYEGETDQRIVFSRSEDEGQSWTRPQTIAGNRADPLTGRGMASWAFPMVSLSGRIYVLYNSHVGINDIWAHTTGVMAGIFSDDNGQTWSIPQNVSMRRSKWDNPDASIPANWIVWQKPERLSEGKYFVGFTRWVSPSIRPPAPINICWAEESVSEFMRFENLDDDPDVKDIRISFFARDDDALRAGLPGYPEVSSAQEPSVVKLPDSRLFCIMRTTLGSPYFSVSDDAGKTWRKPTPLRYDDSDEIIPHPWSPCPIYDAGRGKYVFLYHNHKGQRDFCGPKDTLWFRRPIYVSVGEYAQEKNQPISFSRPRMLMDNEGVPLGKGNGRCDMAMYASLTVRKNIPVLWYPDRKVFLLGKSLPYSFLEEA